MKKLKTYNENQTYVDFNKQKDRALEKLRVKALGKISDELKNILFNVYHFVATQWNKVPPDMQMTAFGTRLRHDLEQLIQRQFDLYSFQVLKIMKDLRSDLFVLSFSGEAEALSRATYRNLKADLSKDRVNEAVESQYDNTEDLKARIDLSLKRLQNKIIDAFHLAQVKQESTEEVLTRVRKAFPKVKRYKKPPKVLKDFKEAKLPSDDDTEEGMRYQPTSQYTMMTGIIDEEAWNKLIDDYKQEFIPSYRGPETVFDFEGVPVPEGAVGPIVDKLAEGETDIFGWEIENMVNHDFMNQVRSGEGYFGELAQKQGITDLVFIALMSETTDECCRWRNGLTVTEIEKRLKGESEDENCLGVAPPLHFNCRCRLVPAGPEIEDYPPPRELGDFETWLSDSVTNN